MANTRGNKPRTSVESGLYSGRKSFGGEDGLGKCDPSVLATPDQTAEHAKGYDNIVKSDWRRGDDVGRGGGAPGVQDRPGFDNDTSRAGNAKPISTGGSNASKSPFSAAHKVSKD